MHRHMGSISLRSYGLNIYISPPALASPQLLAFTLFQYLRFLPCVPQQLPTLILFQYLNFLPGAPQQLRGVI